jgi:hypothetical protein
MKLDPDLARDLLLKIEQAPPNHDANDLQVDGRDKDEVFEHLELLHEAGLIEARIVKSGMGGARVLAVMVERMTWEGHDFLNKARQSSTWKRAKDLVVSKGAPFTFDVLKAVLTKLATDAILP